MRLLFKGGYNLNAVIIQGWLLFKGGYNLNAVIIQGWLLFKGGFNLQKCRNTVCTTRCPRRRPKDPGYTNISGSTGPIVR